MQPYTIKPLFNQILFKRIDLNAPSDIIIPDGATGKIQAAHVLDVGPDCKAVVFGDNVILAEGVTFCGYPGPDEMKPNADGVLTLQPSVVHLISEQCIVGKYVKNETTETP